MNEIELVIPHRLQFSPSHLEDFLDVMQQKENPNDYLQPNEILVCRPDGTHAMDLKNWNHKYIDINSAKCFGCMACVNSPPTFTLFTPHGAPTSIPKSGAHPLNFIGNAFQGKVWKFAPNPGALERMSSQSEEEVNNPLAAILLWRISINQEQTYFSCSPQPGEVDLNTGDERKSKLDVVIGEINSNIITVLEGKTDARETCSSKNRNQWNRYLPALEKVCQPRGITAHFAYVIGGLEDPMYPANANGALTNSTRAAFFHFLKKDNKRFVSLEALRAMYLWKLFQDKDFSWEQNVLPLFGERDFVGVVSGGIIRNSGVSFVLERAPWA
jgi:hypothetical protein